MKKKTHLWTDDGGIRGERPAVVHCKRRHVSRVLERITLTTFGGNQRIARNEKREGLVMWESLHKLWAALLFVAPCVARWGDESADSGAFWLILSTSRYIE